MGQVNPPMSRDLLAIASTLPALGDEHNVGLVNQEWQTNVFSLGREIEKSSLNTSNTEEAGFQLISSSRSFGEVLISAEQAERLGTEKLDVLRTANGMQALGDGLINIEQAIQLNHRALQMLIKHNMQALKEGLITPVVVIKFASDNSVAGKLALIQQEGGMKAMREGLITFEQACNFDPSSLAMMIGGMGMSALREGVITPEDASKIASTNSGIIKLKLMLREDGKQALREGLITGKQACDLTVSQLSLLLKSDGLRALREQLITHDVARKSGDTELSLRINCALDVRDGKMTAEKAQRNISTFLGLRRICNEIGG